MASYILDILTLLTSLTVRDLLMQESHIVLILTLYLIYYMSLTVWAFQVPMHSYYSGK